MLNEKQQKQLEQIQVAPMELIEQTLEKICDNCVWPYRETDQDAMDQRCENCAVEQAVHQLVEKVYQTGYVVALVESSAMLAETLERSKAELEEKRNVWRFDHVK